MNSVDIIHGLFYGQTFFSAKAVTRGASSRKVVVDAEGAMLGPDCVLVRRSAAGYRCVRRAEAAVI
jgi:hypothetical protein